MGRDSIGRFTRGGYISRHIPAGQPEAGAVIAQYTQTLGQTAAKSDSHGAAIMVESAPMKIDERIFGQTTSAKTVSLYTLTNDQGMVVKISDYGGTITSISVPDRQGQFADVVLGFDEFAPYSDHGAYFGCLVGRFANRIAGGRFILDGQPYTLAVNNGPNHLHGGLKGFDKAIWTAAPFTAPGAAGLTLTTFSPAGEEGYPGDLTVTVTYTLTNENALRIAYQAAAAAPTILNLTNHTYFNLLPGGDILDHALTLHAPAFTPVDAALIPTGELRPVHGTPFDFTSPTPIGARIHDDDEQLRFAGGYDHNWVLDSPGELTLAATVHEPANGRFLETYTTQPGVQFYSGNFLDGALTGKDNTRYTKRSGFCLETQHFPDSPNQPAFPTTRLNPGEEYAQTTVYQFSTR